MLELPDQDFETTVMKMLELGIANCLRMEIAEMEITILEFCEEKDLLDRFNSRVEIAEGRISQLENRPIEFTLFEKQR